MEGGVLLAYVGLGALAVTPIWVGSHLSLKDIKDRKKVPSPLSIHPA